MPRPHEVAAARHDPRLLRAARERQIDPSWRARGVCQQVDPEMFFPAPNEPADAAIRMCLDCEVQGPCLAWALDVGDCHGVWGGTSPRERRAMIVAWRGSPERDGARPGDGPPVLDRLLTLLPAEVALSGDPPPPRDPTPPDEPVPSDEPALSGAAPPGAAVPADPALSGESGLSCEPVLVGEPVLSCEPGPLGESALPREQVPPRLPALPRERPPSGAAVSSREPALPRQSALSGGAGLPEALPRRPARVG